MTGYKLSPYRKIVAVNFASSDQNVIVTAVQGTFVTGTPQFASGFIDGGYTGPGTLVPFVGQQGVCSQVAGDPSPHAPGTVKKFVIAWFYTQSYIPAGLFVTYAYVAFVGDTRAAFDGKTFNFSWEPQVGDPGGSLIGGMGSGVFDGTITRYSDLGQATGLPFHSVTGQLTVT